MKYYISSDKVIKKVDNQSDNIGAYKNIFFDSFSDAGAFLKNIYGTSYDMAGVKYCTPNFAYIQKCKEDLKNLRTRYVTLEDEYKEYNLDIDNFINTEEWAERKRLAKEYYHKEGKYLFYLLDYKDKKKKNLFIFNKNNCLLPTYVGFHGALVRDVSKDEELNNIKQQVREVKTQELEELEQEYQDMLDGLEFEYTHARMMYTQLHEKYREKDKRKNDLKNTIIEYSYRKEYLQEQIVLNELWLYSTINNSGIVIKNIQDLQISDINYSKENGYNIYVIVDNKVRKVKYVGNAYNRIGILDGYNQFVRYDTKVLVDIYAGGESIDYLDNSLDFIDREELFLKKETKLNDRLDNFYNKNVLR